LPSRYDGTRVLIIKYANGNIRLQNRHGIDYTYRLLEFVEAAKMLRAQSFVLDGEACYVNPVTGKVEFTPSQRRCATQDVGAQMFLRQKYPLKLMTFDILMLNGEWLVDRRFLERKQILWQLLRSASPTLQYVPHRFDLRDFFEEVKARGDEGLILKRVDSRYRGERSYDWLKVKNWKEEVCRVVGYTPGKNARAPFFGALVLATEDGRFRGCVGSGFSDWELRKLKDIFTSARKVQPPFSIGEPYTAVDVDLKVLVQYYKATQDGVLRFPVFKGIIP